MPFPISLVLDDGAVDALLDPLTGLHHDPFLEKAVEGLHDLGIGWLHLIYKFPDTNLKWLDSTANPKFPKINARSRPEECIEGC